MLLGGVCPWSCLSSTGVNCLHLAAPQSVANENEQSAFWSAFFSVTCLLDPCKAKEALEAPGSDGLSPLQLAEHASRTELLSQMQTWLNGEKKRTTKKAVFLKVALA